jgi:hypothetical protein
LHVAVGQVGGDRFGAPLPSWHLQEKLQRKGIMSLP